MGWILCVESDYKIMAAVCMGKPAYRRSGNNSTVFWSKQICRRRIVSPSLKPALCVLTLGHNFHSVSCLFWCVLPYPARYFTSLTTYNSVVSCMGLYCHITRVLCEERCVCSVTSGKHRTMRAL
jgi:hypothetical protein